MIFTDKTGKYFSSDDLCELSYFVVHQKGLEKAILHETEFSICYVSENPIHPDDMPSSIFVLPDYSRFASMVEFNTGLMKRSGNFDCNLKLARNLSEARQGFNKPKESLTKIPDDRITIEL